MLKLKNTKNLQGKIINISFTDVFLFIRKSVLDASFNNICELLKWKTKIQGKYYYQVDTYYPSSKTCSHCESKTEITNNLNIREWECVNCGPINDREINASINIMYEGIKLHYQTI